LLKKFSNDEKTKMNFIIFDLEATCWRGRPPGYVQEIIEIGAVKMNGFGEITDQFNRFVKPILYPNLSAFCQELTSITQAQVNRASKFDAVIEDFQDWIDIYEESYLLCSWGKFDKTALINDCELHDIDSDWVEEHINVKKQYQTIKKLSKPRGLRSAVEKEGFDFTGIHHRGISDAENLAKIFGKYLDEWRF
jgi:inhibitor of KinA sporulation pathway (predicted exonuclease)